MLVPRCYGGYEVEMETFLRVVASIARGCPSTAWMLGLGAQHALVAATRFGEEAQDELFADGDFICPGTTPPLGTIERDDDGGWIVNGLWPFCSGSPYGSYYLGHAMSSEYPDAPVMFIAPRSQWERLDDWGEQLGLKGSGSHSIKIENGRIPDHFVLPGVSLLTADASQGTPGLELHGNPIYSAPHASELVQVFAALAVGMVLGALDAYREIANSKTTYRPPRMKRSEAPEHQRWFGRATALLSTAEAALRQMAREWTELAEAGSLAGYHDMRIVTMIAEIHEICWKAMDHSLFRTAGSTSVRRGERIERVWRDMSTLHTHTGFLFLADTAEIEVGRRGLLGE